MHENKMHTIFTLVSNNSPLLPFQFSLFFFFLSFLFLEKKISRARRLFEPRIVSTSIVIEPWKTAFNSAEQYGGISEGEGAQIFRFDPARGSLTANTIRKIFQGRGRGGGGESILPAKTRKLFQQHEGGREGLPTFRKVKTNENTRPRQALTTRRVPRGVP